MSYLCIDAYRIHNGETCRESIIITPNIGSLGWCGGNVVRYREGSGVFVNSGVRQAFLNLYQDVVSNPTGVVPAGFPLTEMSGLMNSARSELSKFIQELDVTYRPTDLGASTSYYIQMTALMRPTGWTARWMAHSSGNISYPQVSGCKVFVQES